MKRDFYYPSSSSADNFEFMKINPTVLMQQVMRHQARGEYAQAKQAIKPLLQNYPKHPEINHLYASLLSASGEVKQSIKFYKKALKRKSKDANCWNDLGSAYKLSKQFSNAITSFEKALKLSPNLAEALLNLGAVYHKIDNYPKAIECVKKSLNKRPDTALAYLLLGNIYKSEKQRDKSIVSYKTALKINPQYHQACYNLALVLRDAGELLLALNYCDKALELNTNYYAVLMLSGEINEHLGNIETAQKFYYQCIETDPESTAAYWNLANLSQEQFSPLITDKMLSLVNGSLSTDSKIYLFFALAKVMEQQQDYSSSFNYLEQANQLKRQQLDKGVVNGRLLAESLRTSFNAEVISRWHDQGSQQLSPIFIVGMPRSGTSLIEQILSGHSDVASGGELETSLELLLDELPQLTGQNWQASIDKLNGDVLQQLASLYAEKNHQLVYEKTFFTDKLPFNFAMVGFLSLLFPRARFVHVYKHPMDSCLSCYKQLFTLGQEFSYSLDELADYYLEYKAIMNHWSAILPDKIFHISYEALVNSPRQQIEQMLGFLSLPWQEDCLQFHKNTRVVKTASAGQVRQGLFKTSLERWKHYKKQLQPLSDKLSEEPASFANKHS